MKLMVSEHLEQKEKDPTLLPVCKMSNAGCVCGCNAAVLQYYSSTSLVHKQPPSSSSSWVRFATFCAAASCTLLLLTSSPTTFFPATRSVQRASHLTWMVGAPPRQLATRWAQSDATSAPDEYHVEDEGDEEEPVTPEELQAAVEALDELEKKKREERRQKKDAVKLGVASTVASAQSVNEANKETDTESYTPKVSTWGVFQRPKDISKAYGGGRTIPAGSSVSRQEQEKRRAEIQALLNQVKTGDAVVPPAMMIAAQNNLTQADRWLEKQNYAEAEYLFRCIRRQLPFRNRLAGRAALELGTVLDAQGRYREAAELYKSLTRHPDLSIRRQAIQLSDSFVALQFFKFENQTSDKSWSNTIRPLLRSFAERSATAMREYHATEADHVLEQQTQRASYFVLAALFLVPMATVAFLSTVTYE
eukprot:EG_transcript_3614